MTTNMKEYIGARYVPIIGRKDEESVLWDDSKPYEPLTIVLYQGNSYTSRKVVPTGTSIFNEEYWAPTGNYNAQIEQYRQDIVRYRESVDDVDEKIDDETTARQNATSYLQSEIDDINAFLPVNFDDKDKMVDYPFHVGIATTIGANASGSTQWYFRKWDNGIAECWGKRIEEANINQEYGAIYENYAVMYEVFPTGLFIEAPIYVNTSWSGIWACVETAGGVTAERSQDFKLWRATEAEVSGYVMTYAIGRWK